MEILLSFISFHLKGRKRSWQTKRFPILWMPSVARSGQEVDECLVTQPRSPGRLAGSCVLSSHLLPPRMHRSRKLDHVWSWDSTPSTPSQRVDVPSNALSALPNSCPSAERHECFMKDKKFLCSHFPDLSNRRKCNPTIVNSQLHRDLNPCLKTGQSNYVVAQ